MIATDLAKSPLPSLGAEVDREIPLHLARPALDSCKNSSTNPICNPRRILDPLVDWMTDEDMDTGIDPSSESHLCGLGCSATTTTACDSQTPNSAAACSSSSSLSPLQMPFIGNHSPAHRLSMGRSPIHARISSSFRNSPCLLDGVTTVDETMTVAPLFTSTSLRSRGAAVAKELLRWDSRDPEASSFAMQHFRDTMRMEPTDDLTSHESGLQSRSISNRNSRSVEPLVIVDVLSEDDKSTEDLIPAPCSLPMIRVLSKNSSAMASPRACLSRGSSMGSVSPSGQAVEQQTSSTYAQLVNELARLELNQGDPPATKEHCVRRESAARKASPERDAHAPRVSPRYRDAADNALPPLDRMHNITLPALPLPTSGLSVVAKQSPADKLLRSRADNLLVMSGSRIFDERP